MAMLFAIGAMMSWGIGDFLIQRVARKMGDWQALFFITFAALVVLFPFIRSELHVLREPVYLSLLVATGLVTLVAALFDFEALKKGKMAVVEPIISLELPVTVGIGVVLLGERLSLMAWVLILVTFIGIFFVTQASSPFSRSGRRRTLTEKGVMMALAGAIGLGFTNILIGLSSQQISPLFAVWFTHSLIAVACIVYFFATNQWTSVWDHIRLYPKTVAAQSVSDNLGWICYAWAATLAPISLTITVSESYVAVAVMLGLIVNRERLKHHQIAGMILTFIGVTTLSFIYG